jgi:uncharacterized protein YecT (DUF1311 family)
MNIDWKINLSQYFFCAFCSCAWIVSCVITTANADERGPFQCSGNTIEQGTCLQKAHESADKELNVVYQALLQMTAKHKDGWDKDLRVAQQKWIEFRDRNCNFYGAYMRRGSGEGLEYIACKARMTKERAAELGRKRDELAERGY